MQIEVYLRGTKVCKKLSIYIRFNLLEAEFEIIVLNNSPYARVAANAM